MPAKMMITSFEAASKTTDSPTAKFGGQPDWLAEARWPISEAWDRPMQFICQAPLHLIDEGLSGRVAYVFATHAAYEERDEFFDPDVIDPDGGENAVIIQPGREPEVETRDLSMGPTLYGPNGEPVESFPVLTSAKDPEFVPREKYVEMEQSEQGQYFEAVEGNKIGGSPAFFQDDEWPEPGEWRLLIQLETGSRDLPFFLNFGASPIVFAFVSNDGVEGKVLIQDS